MVFGRLWWKRLGVRFILSFTEAAVDQFTTNSANTHTHTHAAFLHLQLTHHLWTFGVMATVSTVTAEKRDDADETASVDGQFRTKGDAQVQLTQR